jgi:flagellar basal-body rod protein FlgC
MRLFSGFDIPASALRAQRTRMDVASHNIANAETTQSRGQGAYRRKSVVLEEVSSFSGLLRSPASRREPGGVRVAAVVEEPAAERLVYMPSHPHADTKGYVHYPDINIIDEMVQIMKSSRIFEANITAMNEAKMVFLKSLEIGRA